MFGEARGLWLCTVVDWPHQSTYYRVRQGDGWGWTTMSEWATRPGTVSLIEAEWAQFIAKGIVE